MIKFTSILESDATLNLASGQHSVLKEIVLKLINNSDIEQELIKLQSGFLNKSQSKLSPKELTLIYSENDQYVDLILATTDWFSKSLQDLGISSIRVYIAESVKKALAEVCTQILSEHFQKDN